MQKAYPATGNVHLFRARQSKERYSGSGVTKMSTSQNISTLHKGLTPLLAVLISSEHARARRDVPVAGYLVSGYFIGVPKITTARNTYLYPPIPTYTCLYLPIPAYTYLYLPIPTYTYLYLPIPAYTYLYLPIPTYTYLYLPRPIPIPVLCLNNLSRYWHYFTYYVE